MHKLIVQKYGGSSVAEPSQIKAIAKRIASLAQSGHPVIVVVSAMGKSTDALIDLAYKISSNPNRRELDMLISTGERVSMSLMSMSLNDHGCRAISFTGSQAGVLTDDSHSNARIIEVKPARVAAELAKGNVVVLAGFQGVSPTTKEITTLGRGGSDTTAVAMAAHFKAERCEIRKDVDGVYSADPKLVPAAKHLAHLHYDHLCNMTFWGAKVLHYRSVEHARDNGVPLTILLAQDDAQSTLVDAKAPMATIDQFLSVNSHDHVVELSVPSPSVDAAKTQIESLLIRHGLPWPQILHEQWQKEGSDQASFLLTAPRETLQAVQNALAQENLTCESDLSSVTVTFSGPHTASLDRKLQKHLSDAQISIHSTLVGPISLSIVVRNRHKENVLQLLHAHF